MQAKTLGKPNGLLAGVLAEIAGKNFFSASNIIVVPLVGTKDENVDCLIELTKLGGAADSLIMLVAHPDGFHLWDTSCDQMSLPAIHVAVLVGPSQSFFTVRAVANGLHTLSVRNEMPWPARLCAVVATDVMETLAKCRKVA